MSLFNKNEYINIEDVHEVMNKLKDTYQINYEEFSNYYDVFNKEKELDNISLDDKVILASYLAYIDVDAARSKSFDITDKKMTLFDYYLSNSDDISDKTTMSISKYIADMKSYKDMNKAIHGNKRTMNEIFRDITGDLKDTNKRHK